jgi:hypothetical protein
MARFKRQISMFLVVIVQAMKTTAPLKVDKFDDMLLNAWGGNFH